MVALRNEVEDLLVAAGSQQAREAGGGAGHVAGLRQPLAHHWEKPLRPLVGNLWRGAHLAPAIGEPLEVAHAVIQDGHPEPLQPAAPGRGVGRRLGDQVGERLHSAVASVAQGARRGVDVLQRRPQLLHHADGALRSENGVAARHAPDLGEGFLDALAGQRRALPPEGAAAKPGREGPRVCWLFCHGVRGSASLPVYVLVPRTQFLPGAPAAETPRAKGSKGEARRRTPPHTAHTAHALSWVLGDKTHTLRPAGMPPWPARSGRDAEPHLQR